MENNNVQHYNLDDIEKEFKTLITISKNVDKYSLTSAIVATIPALIGSAVAFPIVAGAAALGLFGIKEWKRNRKESFIKKLEYLRQEGRISDERYNEMVQELEFIDTEGPLK